jgi:phosphonoacetaldehyde hydrolase
VKRLQAVIFDWAGTTIDHGSLAPVRAVTELFQRHGIALTDADARRDMGIFKKDHIRRILGMPRVESEWRSRTGKTPDERDVEKLFSDFMPLQMFILEDYAQLIPGVAEISTKLRGRGLRLGSTTGYTRPMLDVLVHHAASRGYRPEISLCPDDTGGGRPNPWMCLRIALEFQLTSTSAAVKVGDTVSDIQEALNAGMWAVGVAATGNEVGLSASALAALSAEDRARRIEQARGNLMAAGAHYVVDAVALLEPVLDEIDDRMAAGERP